MKKALAFASAVILSLLPAMVLAGPEVEVTSLGRDRIRGTFEGCDGVAMAVKTDSGIVKIPLDELVEAVFVKVTVTRDPSASQMILDSGDRFCGRIVGGTSDGIGLVFSDSVLGSLSLPDLGRVRWLLFPPVDGMPKLPQAREGNDIVTRRKGGAISGSVVSFGPSSIRVERGELDLAIEIALDDLKSVYIAPLVEYRGPSDLLTVISTVNGSVLTGRLGGFDGTEARIKTTTGLDVSVPAGSVAAMGTVHGRFAYVSDLEPLRIIENPWLVDGKVTHEPPFGGKFIVNYKKDRSYTGKPLSINGRTFLKGIGSHSWCELEYSLDGSFEAFEAMVGIDDCAGPGNGSVVFRVLLDGKEAAATPVMVGGAKPVDLRVPLGNAKKISLVVDFAREPLNVNDPPGQMELHSLDRADWALARLVKKRN